jgi:hypothetical protein
MSLVGLDGNVFRELGVDVKYKIDEQTYSSSLLLRPSDRTILQEPALATCAKSGRVVPLTCIEPCQISGARVLRHLLQRSEKSGRTVLPEFMVTCGVSGKRLAKDEAEASGITGKLVDIALLETSALSGIKAEREHLAFCDFTQSRVLKTELERSEISQKSYRRDQLKRSVLSSKAGHISEFVSCSHTGDALTNAEAAKCEVTGRYARPDVLIACEATGKRVLPTELERCTVSGKRALKAMLVTSSISGSRMLEVEATRSATGEFCSPAEVGLCAWSNRKCHPSDLRTCGLTGLCVLFQFAGSEKSGFALQPLVELLDGLRRSQERSDLWVSIATKTGSVLGKGRCKVEAALLSPSAKRLAVCIEVRTLLGLRTHQAGVVYALDEAAVVGRVRTGQRRENGWVIT